MKLIKTLSMFALVLTIAPAILFAAGMLGDGSTKLVMLAGTVLWFLTAPRWLHGGES